jgi:DNA-binding response OmpR family regulator
MKTPFKVLILEDDPGMREALGEVLSEEGYQVTLTQRGEDAVAKAASESFDLVISDIKLPGMDGLDAVEIVKQHHPSIKTIIVTGYSTEAHAARSCKLGVSEYLEKPFRLDDLLQQVRQILGERTRDLAQREHQHELEQASISCLRILAKLAGGDSGERLLAAGRLAARLAGRPEEGLTLTAEIVTLLAGCRLISADLDSPDFGPTVAELTRGAQEHWDGSGPLGWVGKEIPFLSRVASVSLFHELDSKRCSPLAHFDPALLACIVEPVAEPERSNGVPVTCRSLLSLAHTMELADDLETAHRSYCEIVADYTGTREECLARLGLVRLAKTSGATERLGELAQEAAQAARTSSPALLAETTLQLGILASTEEPALASEFLEEAVTSYKELRDETGAAKASLARASVETTWSDDAEQALSLLRNAAPISVMAETSDWLLPILLEHEHPAALELLRDFPEALIKSLQQGPLTVSAKMSALNCLSSLPDQKAVVILAQDSEPRVREEARRLLGNDASLQPPALRVYLFGAFEVFSGSEKFTEQTWKRKKVRNLLAYLVVNWRKPVAEERLLQEFWPGSFERGKRSLYQATWELRRALRRDSQPEFDYIKRSGGFFSLNRDLPLWADFERFENAYVEARKLQESGREDKAADLHAQVVKLARGPFLEDCYQDWASVTRNSVTQRLMTSHSYLMKSAKVEENSLLCQEHAKALLDLDAYHQPAHLGLMEAWLDLGHPARAIEQFESCRKLLSEELDIEPSDELLKVYQRARLGN